MKFTLTGTGTSQGVPVIGCKCKICQSEDRRDNRLRSSGVLQSEQTTLVFDTGPDFRYQMLRAGIQRLDAVVFTHEHKDHVAGLDDIRPYYFMQGKEMDVYATEGVIDRLKVEYSYAFEENRYPGAPGLKVHEIDENLFQIGDIELLPIPVMHGKLPVLGFRVGGLAYITDTNFIPQSSMEKLENLDVLVLDALRQNEHSSHFSLEEAISVAKKLKPGKTYFTHISHLMGLHEAVNQSLPENMSLAYDGLMIEF